MNNIPDCPPAHARSQVMPPKGTKRTSGGGGGGKSKAKKGSSDQLPALPAGALHLPHMAIFEEWLIL